MLVNAKVAMDFVNSHEPTYAKIYYEDGIAKKFFILSEAVQPSGKVKWETDVIECSGGRVDLKQIENILGY